MDEAAFWFSLAGATVLVLVAIGLFAWANSLSANDDGAILIGFVGIVVVFLALFVLMKAGTLAMAHVRWLGGDDVEFAVSICLFLWLAITTVVIGVVLLIRDKTATVGDFAALLVGLVTFVSGLTMAANAMHLAVEHVRWV